MPVLLLALVAGCSDGPVSSGTDPTDRDLDLDACDLETSFLVDTGLGRDDIPAITDPEWTGPGSDDVTNYLRDDDRVVGLVVDGQAWAVPHNILWHHEIANLNLSTAAGTVRLAVTYCPLTGSALVFDRAGAGGSEFGVSGLLYKNNLVMYDRATGESLWPQMLSEARCGPDRGTVLPRYPSWEMTWAGWKSLHPETRVVAVSGDPFPYDRYPYGDYEEVDAFDFPMPALDPRRPPKERVLGIPGVDGTLVAFPFGALESAGRWVAAPVTFPVSGRSGVVLWSRELRAAAAYVAEVDGEEVALEVRPTGIYDVATGSRWNVEGRAIDGLLTGEALEPVEEAYVAFWGAWAAFFPETDLWSPDGASPGTS